MRSVKFMTTTDHDWDYAMKKLLAVMGVLLLLSIVESVKADSRSLEPKMARPGAGLTIYMDVSAFGRKNRAAAKMTELHNLHYEKGWKVVDVDPYIENGDLQGFFITYVGRSMTYNRK